jgi:cell wall-associated NlpC family hydrolase
VALTAAVDAAAPPRDSYSVTAKVTQTSVPNLWSGGPAPAQVFSGEAVLAYAASFVGKVPYGTGNSPTTSFSCDGFTQYVFAGFGISLPRGADHQARLGVRISQAEAKAGDFIYWPGRHIGIYDGAGGFYDSPTWGRYVQHSTNMWGSPIYIRLQ